MGWVGKVALVERRALRTSWWSAALLVGIVGLSSGVAMAATAGGRRAATSYDRLLEWSGGADTVYAPGYGPVSEEADQLMSAVAELPEVESVARDLAISNEVVVEGERLPFLDATVAVTDFTSGVAGRLKVLSGAIPEPSDIGAAVTDFATADRLDLAVGDEVQFVPVGDPSGSLVAVTIAAVVVPPGSFPTIASTSRSVIGVAPALVQEHPEWIDWSNAFLFLELRDGATADDLRASIERAGLIGFVFALEDQAPGVRKLVRVEAGVMWFVAAVIAAVTSLVVVQFLRRDIAAKADALALSRVLGLTRREAVATGLQRGVRLGAVGAVIGAGVAVALSPLLPIGIARTADPDPGLHVDLAVLVPGVALVVVLCAAAGGLAVALVIRRERVARPEGRRSLSGLLTSTRPTIATGTRLALAGEQGRSATAARIGVVSLACVLATVVAAVSVRHDFDRLIAEPRLSGAAWDMTMFFDSAEDNLAASAALAADPNVVASTIGGWADLTVDGRPVTVAYLEPGHGIEPALVRGRSPENGTEIALGSAEMEALGVDVGDSVEVSVETEDGRAPRIDATVTGESVLVSPNDRELQQGGGGVVALAAVRTLGHAEAGVGRFAVLRAADSEVRHVADTVAQRVAPVFWYSRAEPSSIGLLRDLRALPVVLIALLCVIAVAAMLQRLLSASRSHRHRLAVLRALGFTDRQARAAGAVHGALLSVLAGAVACVGGMLLAAVVWRRLADYLGVVPSVQVAGVQVALVAVGVVVVGVGAGIAVADRARRLSPATVLREG